MGPRRRSWSTAGSSTRSHRRRLRPGQLPRPRRRPVLRRRRGHGSVYAYALKADGTFPRIATIATTFALVADVQLRRRPGRLWVVCDEACDGRTRALRAGRRVHRRRDACSPVRPAWPTSRTRASRSPTTRCASPTAKPTFYADDADTDGFSLRQGTLPCEAPGRPGELDADADPEPDAPTTFRRTDGTAPVPPSELTDATRTRVGARPRPTTSSTVTISLATARVRRADRHGVALRRRRCSGAATHARPAAGHQRDRPGANLAAGALRAARARRGR